LRSPPHIVNVCATCKAMLAGPMLGNLIETGAAGQD
jgi:hypothetical protein